VKVRTTVEADLDHVLAAIADKSINTTSVERFQEKLQTGEYRPEWIWVTEHDGRILAVAVWWGPAEADRPVALDGLFAAPDVDQPVPLWTELIEQVTAVVPAKEEQPSYHIFLPGGDWRTDAGLVAALTPRLAAAAAAGMTGLLERLRFEWTPAAPVPVRPTRLEFRVEPDDEAFLDVFKRVAAGSLDATTHDTIARVGLDGYARENLELYKSMPGPREWWKLAYNRAGELVGFGMPSRNQGGPMIGFLGVLPEHRGHGYVDDVLAEITADLAERGATRIVADTDLGNAPMAAAFRRAGYHNFGVRLVASKPAVS
jgi:ribosomal protein S18 acetylase RimI-like enzyme